MATQFADDMNAMTLTWFGMIAEGLARGAKVRQFVEDGERFAEFTFPDGTVTEFVDV
jgi:hypothetical protein